MFGCLVFAVSFSISFSGRYRRMGTNKSASFAPKRLSICLCLSHTKFVRRAHASIFTQGRYFTRLPVQIPSHVQLARCVSHGGLESLPTRVKFLLVDGGTGMKRRGHDHEKTRNRRPRCGASKCSPNPSILIRTGIELARHDTRRCWCRVLLHREQARYSPTDALLTFSEVAKAALVKSLRSVVTAPFPFPLMAPAHWFLTFF